MDSRNAKTDREGGSCVPRKPYERPAFTWEEATEILKNFATACGHFAGQGEPCESNPGTS